MSTPNNTLVLAELVEENNRLRAILGNSKLDCVYCKLPAVKQNECASGFPGCARADDQMLCPHVGDDLMARQELEEAKLMLREAREELGSLRMWMSKGKTKSVDTLVAKINQLVNAEMPTPEPSKSDLTKFPYNDHAI